MCKSAYGFCAESYAQARLILVIERNWKIKKGVVSGLALPRNNAIADGIEAYFE
jgi:hypothetical protein